MKKFVQTLVLSISVSIVTAQVPGAKEPSYPRYPVLKSPHINAADDEGEEEIETIEEVEIMSSDYVRERVVESPYYGRRAGNGQWSYYYENGKMGLKVNGEKVTPPIYDRVTPCQPFSFIVRQNDKFGLVDSTGKTLLDCSYDLITQLGYDFLRVGKGKKEGLYHEDGTEKIGLKYKKIIALNRANQVLVEDKKDRIHLLNCDGEKLQKNLEFVVFYQNCAIVKKKKHYALFIRDQHSKFEYDTLHEPGVNSRKKYTSPPRYGSSYKSRNRQSNQNKASKYSLNTRQNIVVLTAEQQDKVGLLDSNMKLVAPIEHDEIYNHRYDRYIELQKNGLKGYYIPSSGIYGPPEYSSLRIQQAKFLLIKLGGKEGMISMATGKVVAPPIFQDITYSNGAFIIKENKKSGILDTNGAMLLEAKYDRINNLYFSYQHVGNSLFTVLEGDKYGVFSIEKGFLLKAKYEKISPLNGMYIQTELNGRFGLYALDGTQLLAEEYKQITTNSASYRSQYPKLIVAVADSLTYVLDSSGKSLFKENLVSFHPILSEKGELNFHNYRNMNHFWELETEKGKSGIFNVLKGEYKIPAVYDEVIMGFVNEGNNQTYFMVKVNGKYGVIDEENKVLVSFQYDTLQLNGNDTKYLTETRRHVREIVFAAKKGNRYGLIDSRDSLVLPFKYKELVKLGVNVYKAKTGTHYTLIDGAGQVLNPGPFDDITQFEYLSKYDSRKWLIKNSTRVALCFYQGQMRELSETGQFLTEGVAMEKHDGFTSMRELKEALKTALNSDKDELLKDFARKICISDHLLYWAQPYLKKEMREVPNFQFLSIQAQYYDELIRFKRFEWNSPKFDRSILDREEYSITQNEIVTSIRLNDRKYEESEILNRLLNECMKINGYWVSTYFVRLYRRY